MQAKQRTVYFVCLQSPSSAVSTKLIFWYLVLNSIIYLLFKVRPDYLYLLGGRSVDYLYLLGGQWTPSRPHIPTGCSPSRPHIPTGCPPSRPFNLPSVRPVDHRVCIKYHGKKRFSYSIDPLLTVYVPPQNFSYT